ncbi:MAG: amidophosphoribosyltransferase [Oligoflexia bacterium]|nr:amidophosphoribosyltransferase [Oligoflexia bacterium]MBF0364660.1 amidophosphoribosyltransferase [Oligoflexia bacterium]
MCGIIGIYGSKHINVNTMLIDGLNTIQHRGQDSAGIVTFNKTFHVRKGEGLVNHVFKNRSLERISPNAYIGLGHVRYSTIGVPSELNAQPLTVSYPHGVAMVHNGNVINVQELKQIISEKNHRLITTENDVELILHILSSELEKKNLNAPSPEDIFESLFATQQLVQGAYSALAIIANVGLVAFTDPHGIRPIVFGEKLTDSGPIYIFASETTSFDYLGFKRIRDLLPGEAIFIDQNLQIHSKLLKSESPKFCIFEYIYFAREDSILQNRSVAIERMRMGKAMAHKIRASGITPDLIIDVPSSAYFFAESLADELGVPYTRGFAKNNFLGRSFIMPSPKQRSSAVKQKLNPIKALVNAKKVAVVDDSIVRGTTSKHIVTLLREAGASKVYFISASPPIKYPCIYGIDMSTKTELIASDHNEEEIAALIGADKVIYQNLEDLMNLYPKEFACFACFNANYPTKVTDDIFSDIERDRCHNQTLLQQQQQQQEITYEA